MHSYVSVAALVIHTKTLKSEVYRDAGKFSAKLDWLFTYINAFGICFFTILFTLVGKKNPGDIRSLKFICVDSKGILEEKSFSICQSTDSRFIL